MWPTRRAESSVTRGLGPNAGASLPHRRPTTTRYDALIIGGGRDVSGREIEELGARAQRQGARGVLATLWPVADQSTGRFMQELYRIRQTASGFAKTKALQRVQTQFVRDTYGTREAHPFFWAPFIPMGSWL